MPVESSRDVARLDQIAPSRARDDWHIPEVFRITTEPFPVLLRVQGIRCTRMSTQRSCLLPPEARLHRCVPLRNDGQDYPRLIAIAWPSWSSANSDRRD